jgi:3-dehydroquinate dehydratase-1
MIKLGNISLGVIPRIAVSVADKESNEDIISRRVDVLEIRVDRFENTGLDYVEESVRERRRARIPVILTVRNDKAEGGETGISDDDKYKIFAGVISLVDALDIELSSPLLAGAVNLARENGKVAVVSAHNFRETLSGAKLKNLLDKAKDSGADIVKIAMQAESGEDIKRLAAFTLENRDKNIITVSLGSLGSVSRLMFPVLGSLLTYSYISKESAPGQVPLEKLRADMRFYSPDYDRYFIKKYGPE